MKVERGYARNGDVNIAYAVAGDGPDFVYVPGFVSHLDLAWESPFIRPYFERLGSGLAFEDRGPHTLKGVPGEWRLFAVAN